MQAKKTSGRKRTILFIDDEIAWLDAVAILLKKESYTIITARSGEDAIVKLRSRKPDLIVSDVRMPIMNGFELYEKVKENPRLSSIPFVFMSSFDDYDARAVAKELGASGYIEKPYDTSRIPDLVQDLLTQMGK